MMVQSQVKKQQYKVLVQTFRQIQLFNNHSDSSFYPNNLNNFDILDNYTPDLEEIEKLCKELESEENKKTCIYEICLMKPEDFFETINYKDDDGNLYVFLLIAFIS
jgi:flagellar assembly factor FliW